MAYLFGSGDGDMNLPHHLSYSGLPAGDLVPVPDRELSPLESALFDKIREHSDRVEYLPPHNPESPDRYRLSLLAGGSSLSATIFSVEEGYGGTRFVGFEVSQLLRRHLGNVSLFSLSDGSLRGENWTGNPGDQDIPLDPLIRYRFGFLGLKLGPITVGDRLAKAVQAATPAPMLRDIIERRYLDEQTGSVE